MMDPDNEILDESKTVCIIGSGLSGLTCGMRLAKAGFNVTVVEELASPGGLLAYTRIGREYLELLPHHLRKSDKALLALSKEMGVDDKIEWYDSAWSGKASPVRSDTMRAVLHALSQASCRRSPITADTSTIRRR